MAQARRRKAPAVPAAAAAASVGAKAKAQPWLVGRLQPFAAAAWYPWAVGALSAVNMLVPLLSGPLVVLFLSGILARPERRYVAAFANALGVTAGAAVLVGMGTQWEHFPTFEEGKFAHLKELIASFGWIGVVSYSALPLLLHPVIFFALAMSMNPAALLGCVLLGRTIKYTTMSQLAISGSKYLSWFGAGPPPSPPPSPPT